MKSFRVFCFLLVCHAPLWAQTKVADVIQAKEEEGALLAVEQSISSLQARQLKPEELTALILNNSTAHAGRKSSEGILYKAEQQSLENAIREELVSFASTRPQLPRGWAEQVMSRQHERISKTIEGILGSSFSDAFVKARKQAIEVQFATLHVRLKPTNADLEQMAGPYRGFAGLSLDEAQHRALESGSAIIDRYVAGAHKGQVIFEENESHLREQASEIFSDELTKLWEQVHYIVQFGSGEEVDKSRIEIDIEKGLSSLPSGGSPFPVTRIAVRERAAELEQDRFLNYAKSQLSPPCAAVPAGMVLKTIPADPHSLPFTLEDHVNRISQSFHAPTASSLLETWTAHAKGPERTALRRRLEQGIRNNDGEQILGVGVRNCVREAVQPFREVVAAKEVAAKAPKVAKLSLAFDDDALDQLSRTSTSEEAERLQILSEVKFHMEEAETLFLTNRRALLDEGWRAAGTQRAFVQDRATKERYQEELAAHRGSGNRQMVQREYEQEVLKQWNQKRAEVLVRVNEQLPDPSKYQDLFKVTRELISDYLKDDSVQPSVSVSSGDAGPGGGGKGTGGGTGDGVGPGSDGGGGGGAGGCSLGATSIQTNSPRPELQTQDSFAWRRLLIVASIGLIMSIWVAYRLGHRSGLRATAGSS